MVGWPLFCHYRGETALGLCSLTTRRPKGSGLEVVDMTDREAVARAITKFEPDLVFHCAAICKVDKCERHPDFARAINVEGTRHLMEVLPQEVRFVYCSSDHVFSGDSGPYFESSSPDPISVYGQTRVEAEQIVREFHREALILRLPLCVGPSYNGRSGHLDWLRYRHRKKLPMTVITDEYRSAIWTTAAAKRVRELGDSSLSGLRHVVGTRLVSRPELAHHLNGEFKIGAQLKFKSRADKPVPHLGKVDLRTEFEDSLAEPLPSALQYGREDIR